jgi:hypothetical protein
MYVVASTVNLILQSGKLCKTLPCNPVFLNLWNDEIVYTIIKSALDQVAQAVIDTDSISSNASCSSTAAPPA